VTGRSWALEELGWQEVREGLRRDGRLVLAVGALEQHGAHLPLGTNLHIAEHVARAVSERLGILRAPPFSYGVPVGRGSHPGVAGLRRKTLHRAINELFAHWEDDGVSEFLVISAHRYEPHLEALLMALTGSAATSVYYLYQIDVSDIVEGDPETEHGGELETSIMLHLAPHLVRRELLRDFTPTVQALRRYTRGRVPTPPPASGGSVGRPSLGDAAKGGRIVQRYVDALCAAIRPNRSPSAG